MGETSQAIAREGKELMDRLPSARASLGALQTRLRDVDSRARALIQERPLMALAAGVAVGYLLRRQLPFGRQ